jgi:hypothetical protein
MFIKLALPNAQAPAGPQRGGMPGRIVWHGVAPLGLGFIRGRFGL